MRRDFVKLKRLLRLSDGSNPGVIKIRPSQPAARLPEIPDATFNHDFLFFIDNDLDID